MLSRQNPPFGTHRVSEHFLDSVVDKFTCSLEDVTTLHGWNGLTPPMSCKCDNSGKFVAVSDEEGMITIVNSTIGSVKSPKQWVAHDNAVFDVAWSSCSTRLITASGDTSCAQWDVNTSKKLGCFIGHTKSVKSVDYKPYDDNVFVSGSRGGRIIVWDARIKNCSCSTVFPKKCCVCSVSKRAHVIKDAHSYKIFHKGKITPSRRKQKPEYREIGVSCVLFQDDHTIVSSGSEGGVIKVWDLRRTYLTSNDHPHSLHSIPYCGNGLKYPGYSHLLFDESRLALYASCTDSVIYKFNFSSYNSKPIAKYYGHFNQGYYIKSSLSPNDEYLISGSGDNSCYIWKTKTPGHARWKLNGHSSEVASVSWNKNDLGTIYTAADDGKVCVWRNSSYGNKTGDLFGQAERMKLTEFGDSFQNYQQCSTPSQTKLSRSNESIENCKTPRSNNTAGLTSLLSPSTSKTTPSNENNENYNLFSVNNQVGSSEVSTEFCTPTSTRGILSPSKQENILHDSIKKSSACRNLDLGSTSQKLTNTVVAGGIEFSPTNNLPNLLLQGTLDSINVVNKARPNVRRDWLTNHRKQAKRRKLQLLSPKIHKSQSSPKIHKSPFSPSTSSSQSRTIDKYFNSSIE